MVYSGRVGGAEHKDGGASSPKYLPLDPNFLQIDVMESLIVASGRWSEMNKVGRVKNINNLIEQGGTENFSSVSYSIIISYTAEIAC